jgi:hypothetical protein
MDHPSRPFRRRDLERLIRYALAAALTVSLPPSLPAQEPVSPTTARPPVSSSVRWTLAAPDASSAWFALLADLRLPGAGAFEFVTPFANGDRPPHVDALARALARSRQFEVLHFLPLYYPSADRKALAAALRAAATTPARTPVPRAELVVAALVSALSADARREYLPTLAAALEDVRPSLPSPSRLAQWQMRFDSLYAPALAPWLRLERLDAGRLIVSEAIGAEGRIFAGTTDRSDNIITVGAMSDDPDPDAPLLAFAREVCFPAVSRAASRENGFDATDATSSRRTSLAAVRCGAELLEMLLPARANAYRAFWLRQAHQPATPARFDAAFPPDPALDAAITASLRRLANTPR